MTELAPRAHRRIGIALAVGFTCGVPGAAASYAQMTLPGLGADILFVLIAAFLLAIDIVLLCKGFRSKASVIVSSVISLALVFGLWAARDDVAWVLQSLSSDFAEKLLGASIVLLPLIMLATPIAQHIELRRRRTRRALWVAIAVQVALAGIAATRSYLNDHPLESTRAEWQALRHRGEQVAPGELDALRDAFEARHDWGTIESMQLLHGVADSELVRGGAPLLPADRAVLVDMLERDRAAARPMAAGAHWFGVIETKLLWDTLQPGSVDRSIPPGTALSEEYMLPFIDQHGQQRLCSGDGLADTDRTALMRAVAGYRGSEVEARVTRSLDRLDHACRSAP